MSLWKDTIQPSTFTIGGTGISDWMQQTTWVTVRTLLFHERAQGKAFEFRVEQYIMDKVVQLHHGGVNMSAGRGNVGVPQLGNGGFYIVLYIE